MALKAANKLLDEIKHLQMYSQLTKTDIHRQWNINWGQRLPESCHFIVDFKGRFSIDWFCFGRVDHLQLLGAGNIWFIHMDLESRLFARWPLVAALAKLFIFTGQRL